ncbi:alpha-amylase family glycosyl hydrolase [Candidatus Haliotispira prima]|uniref:Alpha-amylase family glycosyl hydrolase n=1 Tax=Candidatus Haliotispira prima TaxID=3034016 RepID=A0ABY8MEL3_9SPIO|nr:alpha-amylase family glycosyl hydrolase [Candidatus Haliotispira prima]
MINGNGVIFNAYPDSCGGKLSNIVELLQHPKFAGAFSAFYILPSLFRSDLDRGFSIQSYMLEETLAGRADLQALGQMGIRLKLDFVLNHLSVQSPQFQDLLAKGPESPYVDFFIDWNKFWAGKGQYNAEGCIVPEPQYLEKLFMRKPGLPVLRLPDDGPSVSADNSRYYWNTFYQSVDKDATGKTVYLGQMDLNAESEQVWQFYEQTLRQLKDYGADIVRLDAFAYLHKEAGQSNFFNKPGTWGYLARLQEIARQFNLELLPEIHATYSEMIHCQLSEAGYMIYDFFFPSLIIYSLEYGNAGKLQQWIAEIQQNDYRTVNMLGCHDGIPLLDIKGLIEEEEIAALIEKIQQRGGRIKDLYDSAGKKISYYQVNATFFSALGGDENKMLLARAVQLFLPGVPQVWYLDLFAGCNDTEKADREGHKEINRTNLSLADLEDRLEDRLENRLVLQQLALLRFRNSYPAFGNKDSGAKLDLSAPSEGTLHFRWTKDVSGRCFEATLEVDFSTSQFAIYYGEMGKRQQLAPG